MNFIRGLLNFKLENYMTALNPKYKKFEDLRLEFKDLFYSGNKTLMNNKTFINF
jgi:hypothetical protein